MSLDKDDVAAVILGRRTPEMAEADIVQGRRGLEARDMTAAFGGVLVGAHHHSERVPTDYRADAPLDLAIAGIVRLTIGRNRVEIRRIRVVGQIGATQTCRGDSAVRAENERGRRLRRQSPPPANRAIRGFLPDLCPESFPSDRPCSRTRLNFQPLPGGASHPKLHFAPTGAKVHQRLVSCRVLHNLFRCAGERQPS